MLHRPGVGLIGHLNLIHPLLAQVLGPREIDYIAGLEPPMRAQTCERVAGGDTVCVIVGDGCAPPAELASACASAGTPLLTSAEPSQFVINVLRPYMQQELGEVTTLHGVFLDVLEMGVLITGASAIGKSELALELISRGNGLVADDIVELYRISPDTLEGRCPGVLRDFLEVRGIGILNIRTIFGETAVRPRKLLKLMVHLEDHSHEAFSELDRLQVNATYQEILGVPIRKVTIPVAAGRNLAVLVEAAVRNFVLNQRGIDSTKEFIDRQQRLLEDGG
jgi:HPr kinase/phosphorylase